jgi:hypothetical protein
VSQDPLVHVVSAEHAGGLRLRLEFEDGARGEIDLSKVVSTFRGLLLALQDPAYVASVVVSDHGTLTWSNGVELDPIVVYCAATRRRLPRFSATDGRVDGAKRGRAVRAPTSRAKKATSESRGGSSGPSRRRR